MVKSKQYGYWNRCWFHEYIFAYLVLPRFDAVYQPHQNLCIDEGMVPWRGNLHFRVYSPDKPDKYGLKAYILCDAENGYCLKMKLYTGKPSVPQWQRCDLRLGYVTSTEPLRLWSHSVLWQLLFKSATIYGSLVSRSGCHWHSSS